MSTMNRTIASMTTAAALATAALAPGAMAADAPAPKLQLKGAYLVTEHLKASHQDFIRAVFRTAKPLPRRYDGLIRASGAIDGVGHSLGTAKRGTTCYTFLVPVKGGSIAVSDGNNGITRKGAKIGRRFTMTVESRDGQKVTRTLKLRHKKAGDASGKPLGC
jgi:hypothetical protein